MEMVNPVYLNYFYKLPSNLHTFFHIRGSPLLFIYISFIYLPSLITHDVLSFRQVDFSSLNKLNQTSQETQPEDFTNQAILDVFFLVVIFCRWCMPKGKITLDDLSKLLLLYITIMADILDMMTMLRDLYQAKCRIKCKDQMFTISLVFVSISILHLCVGFTATRNKIYTMPFVRSPKSRVPMIVINNNYDSSTILRIRFSQLLEIFYNLKSMLSKMGTEFLEKEIWGMF
jgi:hypothetical protein